MIQKNLRSKPTRLRETCDRLATQIRGASCMAGFDGGFNWSMQHTMTRPQAEGVLQMNRRSRTYYTDNQKALMRERWKAAGLFTRLATYSIDRTRRSITFCRGRVAFGRQSAAVP